MIDCPASHQQVGGWRWAHAGRFPGFVYPGSFPGFVYPAVFRPRPTPMHKVHEDVIQKMTGAYL